MTPDVLQANPQPAMTASRANRNQSPRRGASGLARAREYFAADARRAIQTALGLLWLLDAGLLFQPFMYSKGFIRTLTRNAAGQPDWLASSITWAARLAAHDLRVANTLFALTQAAIGLGLLHRKTVKPALVVSFAWAIVAWWFGEGLGMLLTGTANPLTGAPGPVLLYAIVGLIVWPTAHAGGLLGGRGARATWGVLWLGMAWLWLLDANTGANATRNAINAAPSGSAGYVPWQRDAASAARSDGLLIASALAALSSAIGIAGAVNWRARPFLALAILLNAGDWVLGQGLGGIFTGAGTDPNAAPLVILLALALFSLTPTRHARRAEHAERPALGAPRTPPNRGAERCCGR